MHCVRAYLALMRFMDFRVPKTVTGFLEKELAAAHHNDVAKMHTWMTVSPPIISHVVPILSATALLTGFCRGRAAHISALVLRHELRRHVFTGLHV